MKHFTQQENQYIAKLIKKAKAKQIEEMIKNINKLKKKPGHSLDHQDYYYQAINDAIAILKD